MAIQIQSTSSVRAVNGIKCTGYGPSKIGKTVLCATAPRPLIASAENGLLSLRKVNVPFVDISDYSKLEEFFKWCKSSSEVKKYDTICLDSASEIAEVILAEELRKNKDPRKAYGNTQQSVYEFIREFRDMPQKHVYLIAKEFVQVIGDGIAATEKYAPLMPSQALQQNYPYFFDVIFNVNADQAGNRFLRCKWNTKYSAGDRSGNLNEIEPPDLTALFTKVYQ